tara:strand:+ start:34 stop:531 length:498 start_codon:yes stop_codon:yes gene_type:complete
MKSVLRKIFFAKSYLYSYPYSSLNLQNDLERIHEDKYFKRNSILRGKRISNDQFLLWEKWNFFRGMHSYDGLSFFSGKIHDTQEKTNIVGTIYPNPIILFAFYFPIIILCFMLFDLITKKVIEVKLEFYFIIGLFILLSLLSIFYFRKRIQKSVEQELKLTNESD